MCLILFLLSSTNTFEIFKAFSRMHKADYVEKIPQKIIVYNIFRLWLNMVIQNMFVKFLKILLQGTDWLDISLTGTWTLIQMRSYCQQHFLLLSKVFRKYKLPFIIAFIFLVERNGNDRSQFAILCETFCWMLAGFGTRWRWFRSWRHFISKVSKITVEIGLET